MSEKVIILGASNKKERYSYKAFELLQQYGHTPIPVHPALKEIQGARCYKSLLEVKETLQTDIDTITVYINPQVSKDLKDDFLLLHPKRVIFNPGSENAELSMFLMKKGILVEEACTLVLLRTGEF